MRAAFDALTAPRVEGYSALADSRRDDQRSRAARSISQARQALGVDEFLKLADVAPSQARAALGSAAAAAGELARASGADEAGVAEARRATLVTAQVRRIGETIGRDPARAAKILEEEGGVLPDAQRAQLSREVELEQARVDANQAAAQMAGEHPDLVDDLDGFLAGMEVAAGEGAHRIEAFRAASMGAWRAARAAREALESQAWAAVSPLLEPESGIHSWTQLPAELWRSLSERQQQAVQARLASPWAESDGPTLDAIRSLAVSDPDGFRDADLMAYAMELKPTDLDRMLARQALVRAGGAEWPSERDTRLGEQNETVPGTRRTGGAQWGAEQEPAFGEIEGLGNPLLIQVASKPQGRAGGRKVRDEDNPLSDESGEAASQLTAVRDFAAIWAPMLAEWKDDTPAAWDISSRERQDPTRFAGKPYMEGVVRPDGKKAIGRVYVTDDGIWFLKKVGNTYSSPRFIRPKRPHLVLWHTAQGVRNQGKMAWIYREDKAGPAKAKLLVSLLDPFTSKGAQVASSFGRDALLDEEEENYWWIYQAGYEVRGKQLAERAKAQEAARKAARPQIALPPIKPRPPPGRRRLDGKPLP